MINIRRRIALWFVGLSALVYIAPTILGGFLFYFTLTSALDSELTLLASSLGHAIDVKNNQPHFRDWARIVQTDPRRSQFTIQLYDVNGVMLEHFGLDGVTHLFKNKEEVGSGAARLRNIVTPLLLKGAPVGYLQIQVSTAQRDEATRQFAWVMLLMAPFVLLGLGTCSYYVSDKATDSIRKTIESLRQFMADAGHELNTPLSIINASTEALQRKLDKSGANFSETEVIASSADRMRKLIDGLSLLAEIEQPAIATTSESTDIRDVVEQGVTEFSVKFEQKDVKLESSSLPNCRIVGSGDSLRMLFFNLLENALRYTEPGGQVKVVVELEEPLVHIKVSDTGIGIPAESLPHIFERFYRVDKSRSRSSGGSGLGLAISQGIAHAHNGNIAVVSRLNEGSTFTVTLPLSESNSSVE